MSAYAFLIHSFNKTEQNSQEDADRKLEGQPLPLSGVKVDSAARPLIEAWKSTFMSRAYDAPYMDLTKRLAKTLESEQDKESEGALEISNALDEDPESCYQLGAWLYQDAKIQGKDREDAAWKAVDNLVQTVSKKRLPIFTRHDTGLEDLGIYLKNVRRTEDFSRPFIYNVLLTGSDRGYELGAVGKLYQVKADNNVFKEATPEQFRKYSHTHSIPSNLVCRNHEGTFSLAFVVPSDCSQVDLVVNEHYFFVYAQGKEVVRPGDRFSSAEIKPVEILIKFFWNGFYTDAERPSLAEFQEQVAQARVTLKAGIFQFWLPGQGGKNEQPVRGKTIVPRPV